MPMRMRLGCKRADPNGKGISGEKEHALAEWMRMSSRIDPT